MRLVLPYPPSVNRMYSYYRGTVVTKADVLVFRKEAKYRARQAGLLPLSGPVAVTVTLFRRNRTGDIDNPIKVLLDSLNGILWQDDKQVTELHVYRFEDKENPRCELSVEVLA